jgi:hypothetical protein
MNDTVVYIHIRNTDDVVFYVGIGNNKRPKSKRDRNPHWKRTVNKYGYYVKIIKEGLTWEEACIVEMDMISHYGRKDKNQGTLVNQTDGGDGFKGGIPWNLGLTPKDEVKQKISNTLKGQLSGENNPFYGKEHSDDTKSIMRESAKKRPTQSKETRVKRSESLKGKQNALGTKRSPDSIEKSKETNKRNTKVKINDIIYRSMREASRQLVIPMSTLKQRCYSVYFTEYQFC